MILKVCVVLLALSISTANCANILFFFGGGSYSHKLSVWPLVTALANRGHNVTVLSGFKNQPSNNTNLHELFSPTIFNMTQGIYPPDRVRERVDGKHSWVLDNFNSNSLRTCESIMVATGDSALDYVISEGKFELVIDNAFYGECGMMIAYQKKAKLIVNFSAPFFPWLHDELGFPDEPATVPDMSFDLNFPMGPWHRFKNYVAPLHLFLSRRMFLYPKFESIMQKRYGLKKEDVPAFQELYRNTYLVMVAGHYSTDFARSLPPFIVNVGGMQCFLPTAPLAGDFKRILDDARDGAVLVAFGSTINLATLPPDIKSSFFSMVRRFPSISFIWRWDGPDPKDKPENLFTSKWLPQFQILGHPNVKGFISHGGLNSVTEATYHAVPVILLPLFADQDYNGYRIEATETGIRLEMREVNAEILAKSLDEVLNNPKYAKNMKEMSSLFRDRPMNPIDEAVYWTEFVLRHNDTKSMKPLQHLTFFQRRLFDVALLFFLGVLTILVTLYRICCFWSLQCKGIAGNCMTYSKINGTTESRGDADHARKNK